MSLYSTLPTAGLQLLELRGKPMTLAVAGILGALAAFVPGEVVNNSFYNESGAGSFFSLVVVTALWMLVYGVAYSIAMVLGQNIYLRRPRLDQKEAMVAGAGGAVAGLVSGALAQMFFGVAVALTIVSGIENFLIIGVARIAAWAMFGALIGLGMSLFIPNMGRGHGLVGGAAGGAVGAIGFIFATTASGDMIGRLIGMAIVGGALGFAIGLVEEASRSAWLQLSFGNAGEGRRVSIGAVPVCIGSDSRHCLVWTQAAPPVAFRYQFIDGQVTCDDVMAERRMLVPPGFEQQLGRLRVVVCVGASTTNNKVSTSAATTPAIPPPPPPPARPSKSFPQGLPSPSSTAYRQTLPSVPSSTVPRGIPLPPPPPAPPPRR